MILHIVNDYSGSTVYKNLVGKLDDLGVQQIVYTPIRSKLLVNKNRIDLKFSDSDAILYSKVLNTYSDKIFYRKKIRRLVKDIENKVDLSKIKFIHAHTWYSDGGVAFELSKKYNIPYIVTVRNTDINLFLKYHVFNRQYGRQILVNASKVITISKVYSVRLLQDARLKIVRDKLVADMMVIPNGVSDFWLKNVSMKPRSLRNERAIKLLYLGRFTSGKNISALINAVVHLNTKSVKFELTLIGGGGSEQNDVLSLVDKYPFVHYVGKVNDLDILKQYYQESDIFTMPSRAETFGLVYIEALSQGVPVLYTQNEGIDGFYENIGEKVIDTSTNEIEKKLQLMVENYSKYNFDSNEIMKNHNWRLIAEKYTELYNSK